MSLYNPRVKIYDFGQLTGVNAGSNTNTAHPITGEVIKIICSGDRTAATGSLFLQTNDMVLKSSSNIVHEGYISMKKKMQIGHHHVLLPVYKTGKDSFWRI